MSKIKRIEADQSLLVFLRELLDYRELLLTFAWRDYRVRYAQTFLGVAWGVLQPLLTILILWLVFSRFIDVDMGEVPPIAFVASGVACWTYFSFVVSQSGQAVIQSQQMVKKIYFPKVLLPLSKALLGMIDLIIVLVLLVVILFWSGVPLRFEMLFIPLVLIALITFSVGLGIWVSSLTIKYRDVQQLVPFTIQVGLYLTPVAYPASFASEMLPKAALYFYYLNPMVGIIEALRYCLFGAGSLDGYSVFSLTVGIVMAASGVWYFHRSERKIADLV